MSKPKDIIVGYMHNPKITGKFKVNGCVSKEELNFNYNSVPVLPQGSKPIGPILIPFHSVNVPKK